MSMDSSTRRTTVADCPIDSFEVIGDADDLPEAFYNALAALLLDIGEPDESEETTEDAA